MPVASEKKTNAMRILEMENIHYQSYTAQRLNKNKNIVYKTLVAQGASKDYYVMIVPVKEFHNSVLSPYQTICSWAYTTTYSLIWLVFGNYEIHSSRKRIGLDKSCKSC